MTIEDTLQKYTPKPLLIVISGTSGVGKDSVIDRLRKRGVPFHFVVTANTRARRDDEVEGEDYIFVTREEFARMIENDELIEYAQVYDDYKGVPKVQVQEAMASGKDVLMRLDVQGAATIRKLYPEALLLFITTKTEEELIARLKARQTETDESFAIRIAMMRKEVGRVDEFDYVVFNNDGEIEEAVDAILHIIQTEHRRVHHRTVIVE